MQNKYFDVYVWDQLWPRVATGNRTVEAQIGHKWVRVREAATIPYNTQRKRIRRSIWNAMKPIERDKPKYLKKKRPKQ